MGNKTLLSIPCFLISLIVSAPIFETRPSFESEIIPSVKFASAHHDLDFMLMLAVGIGESDLSHTSNNGKVKISKRGAVGIFQMMSNTMPVGLNQYVFIENIWAAAKVIKDLKKYYGNTGQALEAYNCGKNGRVKYPVSARIYRKKIFRILRKIKAIDRKGELTYSVLCQTFKLKLRNDCKDENI